MKGSKCKVCGHEHWLREPHIGLKPSADDMKRAGVRLNQAPIPTKGRQTAPARGKPEKPRATAKAPKPARNKIRNKKREKKHA